MNMICNHPIKPHQRMIILTGMDNSGKTTLATRMGQDLNLPIVKSIGPGASPSEKDLWLLDQLTREKAFPGSVIYDRFLPLEEMVYGPILRDGSQYNLESPLVQELKSLDPIIIYTRPHSQQIFNFGDREQMEGVIETHQQLLQAWDDLMWSMTARDWDIRLYDYTTELMNP